VYSVLLCPLVQIREKDGKVNDVLDTFDVKLICHCTATTLAGSETF